MSSAKSSSRIGTGASSRNAGRTGRIRGRVLVREGLAWAYTRYSDTYAELEAEARAGKAGIWQAPTIPPWERRAQPEEHAAAAAAQGCAIKGNISAKGEWIYHAPQSPWYARPKVSEADGERWFCDEAEAQAAGWRDARF